MANVEANSLADHGVVNHMSLPTGVFSDFSIPIPHQNLPLLSMQSASFTQLTKMSTAIHIELRADDNHKLSKGLCNAGLILKGLLGEVAVRFLLMPVTDTWFQSGGFT